MEFKEITCCNCYVLFKITVEHQKSLASTKETFFCPNGHGQNYTGESDSFKLDKIKRKLIVEEENNKRILEVKNEKINNLNNRIRTYKGHVTRGKKK